MASSSNRKSNSSASRAAKPTYRRAGFSSQAPSGAKRSAAPRSGSSRSVKRSSYTGQNRVRQNGPAPVRPAAASRPAAARTQRRQSAQRRPRSGYTSVPARSSGSRKGSGNGIASRLGTLAGRLHMPHVGAPVVLGFLGVLAVLAVAAVIVFNSGLFAATDIQIKGSEHMTAKDARRLIDIPEGTSLFNIDEKQIAEDLQQNPWISGVSVERTFPHTLTITPTERKVSAIAYMSADELAWAIDDSGAWIAPLSTATDDDSSSDAADPADATDATATGQDASADSSSTSSDGSATSTGDSSSTDSSTDGTATDGSTSTDATASDDSGTSADSGTDSGGLAVAQKLAKHYGALLLIDVPSDVAPASGETVKSDVVNAGLAYAKGFSADFLKQVKDISVPSTEAITAHLKSGVEVSLGSAEKIERKEKVVTRLLSQEEGVTYINVRTPGSYTFRQAPTS